MVLVQEEALNGNCEAVRMLGQQFNDTLPVSCTDAKNEKVVRMVTSGAYSTLEEPACGDGTHDKQACNMIQNQEVFNFWEESHDAFKC